MPQAKLNSFVAGVRTSGYAARETYPVESWTSSPAAAENYSGTAGTGWSVILRHEAPDTKRFKSIGPLVRSLAGKIGKSSQPPVQTEAEWIFGIGKSLAVRHMRRDQALRRVIIDLEERR